MNILSIDTTAEFCSVALLKDELAFEFHEHRPREHAKILMPTIEQLAEQAQIRLKELDLVVFGRGPGSFTGVRIATGVAQGLGYSLACPLMPISTLQSLAFTATGGTKVWVAIDARMSEVYFAGYEIDELGIPREVVAEQVIAPALIEQEFSADDCFIGNGWAAGYPLPAHLPSFDINSKQVELPNALASAKLARLLTEHNVQQPVSAEQALPVYLRDKVTWDNKPKIGS